ncbi:MAG TPA: primosomal protein N' [Acidobacteriota bacterium]|jgi:primosomal protein N' (replication factor Y)|nr:primosomal protein N' [Acidobacteriota bacterium]
MRLVQVAVAAPVRKTFTYTLTADLELSAGMRVLVPFGRKLLTGYVVGFPDNTEIDLSLLRPVKKALDFEPIISPELIQLGFWLAQYYLASPGEVFRSMLPAGLNFRGDYEISLLEDEPQRSLLGEQDQILAILRKGPIRFQKLARRLGRANLWQQIQQLKKEGVVAVREYLDEKSLEKTALFVALMQQPANLELTLLQKLALEKLKAMSLPVRLSELARHGVSPATIRSLEKKGSVRLERRAVRRDPFHAQADQRPQLLTLTGDQEEALRQIRETLEKGQFQSFLIHGVTGSGKTEIYLNAIAETLQRGKTALMLVPEIALTPALSRVMRSWFGESVAILHSSLSAGERHDEWQRIRKNEARVVIGTRSAVFCPLQNLGVIIVDEEHDSSYKQEENPMYNGRDTALLRGRFQNALVVLGSATPALETYFQARQAAKHHYIWIAERVRKRPLPAVHIMDMRVEFEKRGKATLISDLLKEAIQERLRKKEQAMILLNRRGYAPILVCRSCGNVMTCQQCSVSLTFHQEGRRLVCHYCGYTRSVPQNCVECAGEYLFMVGEGTERVQEVLQKLFSTAVVDRLDRDSVRAKGSHEKILRRFDQGETQILVGTQMIAKGHDFPNVTLVGVLNADSGLRIPDFRSAERTFQLITQVAGRSGRGDVAGEVIVQTYYPNHYALRFACMQDYRQFYEQEIRYRKLFSYPPFSHLAVVLSQDIDRQKAEQRAKLFADAMQPVLQQRQAGGDLRVLGPSEALLGKLKGSYRFQTLLKSRNRRLLHEVLEATLESLEVKKKNTSKWIIDIDPIQIL